MRIFQVDAFTSEPFTGNPAGVCLLEEERSEAWMQAVAAEMNLAETAFVRPTGSAFSLRWFTPACEVNLCGHGTLSTAHILWEQRVLPNGAAAEFDTRSGRLTARQVEGLIELDFPAKPVRATAAPQGMLAALAAGGGEVEPVFVGESDFCHFIELASEDAVRSLRPDFRRLVGCGKGKVVVTAASGAGAPYDFVSRFFAPVVGVDEDPVTGSAHCALAPYWAAKLGREALAGYQASARGGLVRCRPVGQRVLLAGRAVTVLEGRLVA